MGGVDERAEMTVEERTGERVGVEALDAGVQVGDGGRAWLVEAHRGDVGGDVGHREVECVRGERDAGDPERVRLGEQGRGDGVVVGVEAGSGRSDHVGEYARLGAEHAAADPVVSVGVDRGTQVRHVVGDRGEDFLERHRLVMGACRAGNGQSGLV